MKLKKFTNEDMISIMVAFLSIGICIGIVLMHFSINYFKSCKVKICTEDGAYCVGDTAIVTQGIYKGNETTVIDIEKSEYSVWSKEREHKITVEFCDGSMEDYRYPLGEKESPINKKEKSQCN